MQGAVCSTTLLVPKDFPTVDQSHPPDSPRRVFIRSWVATRTPRIRIISRWLMRRACILEDDRMAQEFGEAGCEDTPVHISRASSTMVRGRDGHSSAVAVPSAAKMAANASPKGVFVIAGRCPCRKSNPSVLVVQAAENRSRLDASY